MFINPKKAIENGWVKNVKSEWIQPNGIDISLDKIFQFNFNNFFKLTNLETQHRDRSILNFNFAGLWELEKGNAYDFISRVYVEIPEGICGWVIIRSTLNRNGLYLGSGLYDSGYKGPVCGTLYNLGGIVLIESGVRVGQLVLANSDNEALYKGKYNTEKDELPLHLKTSLLNNYYDE